MKILEIIGMGCSLIGIGCFVILVVLGSITEEQEVTRIRVNSLSKKEN